jgi:hypothetical protein
MFQRSIVFIFLLSLNFKAFTQDSLCYSQIDGIVKRIQDLPCSILDTGSITKSKYPRFRDCYITDSSGRSLRAIISSVTDSTFGSEYLAFFFYKNELIKVETGQLNGYKRMGLVYYYYTKGDCQPFEPTEYFNIRKAYYQRLSQVYIDRWIAHK